MANLGNFSRALLQRATAIYYGGVSVSLMDALGNILLGDDLPPAPTVTSTIADRTYEAGAAPVTVDLRTKFGGATSYTVSPTNAAVTISDYTLTINPTAALTATTFTVRGINGGGASAPLTFALTVTAPVPVLLKPFPDQSLLIGGGTVTLPLAEYFSGAATYAVSPANQGVTLSNGNVVISRAAARDVVITVTATNATGQDTSDSFALVVGAPANQAPVVSGAIPKQAPVANVAFSANLASYFSDPDGDPLIFDYTGTLPTGITRTGAVFSGTATVTGQTASGVLRARDPGNLEAEAPVAWLVAVQPILQATIAPDPLVAGQPATITFNEAPDNVSMAHGQSAVQATRVGTSMAWTFTVPADDTLNLVIGATKAGHTAYSGTFDVQPAPPQFAAEPGGFALTAPATAPAITMQIAEPTAHAGTVTVDPATIAEQGAQWLRNPVAARPQTGPDILTMQPGLPAQDRGLGPWTRTRQWLRGTSPQTATAIEGAGGLTYAVDPQADGGMTIYPSETVTPAQGDPVQAIGAGIAVAAAATGIPDGLVSLGLFQGQSSGGSTHEAAIALGDADPQKTLVLLIHTPSEVTSARIIVGSTEYPLALDQTEAVSSSSNWLALVSAAVPAGGNAVLRVWTAGYWTGAVSACVMTAKALSLAAKYKDRATMTAGTAMPRNVVTQTGDRLLYAILSAPYAPGGVFDAPVVVQEIIDTPLSATGPQLWVGLATETAGANPRTLNITPNQSGNAVRMSAVYRGATQ